MPDLADLGTLEDAKDRVDELVEEIEATARHGGNHPVTRYRAACPVDGCAADSGICYLLEGVENWLDKHFRLCHPRRVRR